MALAVAPDHLARSSSRPFAAVLFDIDGTLDDSVEMIVAGLSDMYERYTGVRPPIEWVREVMPMALTEQFKRFPGEAPSHDLVDEMTLYAIERYEVHADLDRPFEAAVGALCDLNDAGISVGVVTNKSAPELDSFLARFPHAGCLGVAVCASDVKSPKPAPDPILLAAARLGVDPGECLFIGDSRFDIAAGRAAGVTTVGVHYGSDTRAELVAAQPDFLLGTPEELREWLAARFAPAPLAQDRP